MAVRLTDEARQYIALFEDETGARVRDCVVDDEYDRLIVLVAAGDMADAIGPGGAHVRAVEEQVGRGIDLVEDADTAAGFVANALAPAAVTGVTISENDDRVAYAEVPDDETGAAIGSGGRNIEKARLLAARHYDIDDIELA